MNTRRLTFRSIDLESHAQRCVEFRRDSYLCSFEVDGFLEEAGPNGERYLQNLPARIAKFPDGYVHIWDGGEIVGQMEMQILEEPRRGYVNLFYLIEEVRGTGAAEQLQDYAMDFCRRHGVTEVQLSVSPTNVRAIAYYTKHGWRDIGPRPGREFVHLMERDVPESAPQERSGGTS